MMVVVVGVGVVVVCGAKGCAVCGGGGGVAMTTAAWSV